MSTLAEIHLKSYSVHSFKFDFATKGTTKRLLLVNCSEYNGVWLSRVSWGEMWSRIDTGKWKDGFLATWWEHCAYLHVLGLVPKTSCLISLDFISH